MFSTDPLERKYPFQSTYAYCYNSPISLIDICGLGVGLGDGADKRTIQSGSTLWGIAQKAYNEYGKSQGMTFEQYWINIQKWNKGIDLSKVGTSVFVEDPKSLRAASPEFIRQVQALQSRPVSMNLPTPRLISCHSDVPINKLSGNSLSFTKNSISGTYAFIGGVGGGKEWITMDENPNNAYTANGNYSFVVKNFGASTGWGGSISATQGIGYITNNSYFNDPAEIYADANGLSIMFGGFLGGGGSWAYSKSYNSTVFSFDYGFTVGYSLKGATGYSPKLPGINTGKNWISNKSHTINALDSAKFFIMYGRTLPFMYNPSFLGRLDSIISKRKI